MFLAKAHITMHMNDEDRDRKYDKENIQVLSKLDLYVTMFHSKIDHVLQDSFKIFNQILDDAKRLKNKPMKNRFERRLSLHTESDILIEPLLLAYALILEHKNLRQGKKQLVPPKVLGLYNQFDGMNETKYRNSKKFANEFVLKLNEVA